jgi:hypothetical protein
LAHLKLKFASKANPAPKVRVLSNIKAPSISSIDMKKVSGASTVRPIDTS